MKKTILSASIIMALSATSVAASDRVDLNNLLQNYSKNESIEDSAFKTHGTMWLVKASANTALSVSEVTLMKSQGLLSAGAVSDVSLDTDAGLDILQRQIEALDVDVSIASRTKNLVAGLVIDGSSAAVAEIQKLSGVESVLPIFDSELHIEDSVEYIKAADLVTANVASGAGTRVAILDSGLDYTHAAVGGPGTPEAYAEASADLTDTPAWPIGQVIGGFDFFNGDPDPMDNNNHGTHVAHSVLGVAPDAEVYAYTVCDQRCPGAAQLAGLEAAMDPNGDGDISDRVDIINMSLGGPFGSSRGGAVAELIDKAVELGVVVAISAGNSGPTPYIVGGPSTTTNALSVGAMTHPTAETAEVFASIGDQNITAAAAAFNPEPVFAVDSTIPIVYPEADTNATGCVPYTTDLTDSIAIIDRGACAFTQKVLNAQAAGAKFVVVVNNQPGAGVIAMGGGSEEEITINSVMVSFEDGAVLKEAVEAGTATFSFASELVVKDGAIATFTSRGPSQDGILKPEITAPGTAIVTAEAGTATESTPISGTSFSSPITAGALSLLSEVFPDRNAFELKATLMNNANLDVTLEPRSVNPEAELAPISYIGAGLVDVEKASASKTAAWDSATKQAALAFGFLGLSEESSITKTVTVKNFSGDVKTYTLSDIARFENDAATEALSMEYPSSITVPAGQTVTFDVTATFDPAKLPEWTLTSDVVKTPLGSPELTNVEFDGALMLTDENDVTMHLVYHAVPKAYGSLSVGSKITDNGVVRTVTNSGVTEVGTTLANTVLDSDIDADKRLDIVNVSLSYIEDTTDTCTSGSVVLTTLTMRDPLPVLLEFGAGYFMDVDVDGDGIYDVTAQTLELSAFGVESTDIVTFTRPFDDLTGTITGTIHEPGSNALSMSSCLEDLGLNDDVLGFTSSTVAFRIEESTFDFFPATEYDDDLVVTNYSFPNNLPTITDTDGAVLESLSPGEVGVLNGVGLGGFSFVSDGGIKAVTIARDGGNAPTIEAQAFDVDENAADGTVVGTITATDADGVTSPVSEIFVQSTNSIALSVSRAGEITVANSALLDFDAGLESVTMEVVAIDTAGNVSDAAEVTVSVNNLADEASEQPAPAEPVEPPRSSGGSMGWIALLLAPVAFLRRRVKR